MLLNLANQDAGFLARYAVERTDDGYIPATREHELYPVIADAYNALQLELTDMSCDIVAVLEEIRDIMAATSLANAAGGQAICCYDLDPASYYEDAPVPGEPEDLCTLAYAFSLAWEAACIEIYHQWAMGAFPSAGVLAAILDEFDAPGQSLLQFAIWAASETLPMLESLWAIAVGNLVFPITCAIYDAAGPAEARDAIYALIEAVPGIGPTAIEFMEFPITYNGLNKVYGGTFDTEGVDTPDCEALCAQEQCAGPQFFATCDPNDEGPCGSGDLSPGLGRVWTASHDASNESYAIYAVLDTNRSVTLLGAPGWVEKEGQPPCRWYACVGGGTVELGSISDPEDLPDETCLGWLVVIGLEPFSVVVDIGEPCEPELP